MSVGNVFIAKVKLKDLAPFSFHLTVFWFLYSVMLLLMEFCGNHTT